MNDDLLELARLARQESARFTLHVEGAAIRASWKRHGESAETVVDYGPRIVNGHNYPSYGVDGVLRELIKRLGYRHVPTNQRFVDLLSDRQRARVLALIQELKEIRRTVLGPATAEGLFASPRSSLHPDIVSLGGADEE